MAKVVATHRPSMREIEREGLRARAQSAFGTVTADLISETEWIVDDNGWHQTQRYMVEGIDGAPEFRAIAALFATGIPEHGSPHPLLFNFLGITANRITSRPASEGSNTQFIVTVEWGIIQTGGNLFINNPDDPAAPPSIEVSTTVQSSTTQLDVNGNPLLVVYEEPDTQNIVNQSAEVEYQVPMSTFIYRRRERNNPLQKSLDYVNHIDADVPHVFGEVRPNHWMCTALSGVTDDGGSTYNVTYEFQRHPETWNPLISYIDPATGRPPHDVTDPRHGTFERFAVWTPGLNTAVHRRRIYPQAVFGNLQLFL